MKKDIICVLRKRGSNGQYNITIPSLWVENNNLTEGDHLLVSAIKDEFEDLQNKTKSRFVNEFIKRYNKEK